jgi:putative chitobiose transport system substrate-binding protein
VNTTAGREGRDREEVLEEALSVNIRKILALALVAVLAVGCGASTSPSPSATSAPSQAAASAAASTSAAPASEAPLAVDPAEAVIPNVEQGAQITFWTYYLTPPEKFDPYINATIARFEATYPGVKVTREDHQGTFRDDLNAAFAAGNAPDVINLSVSEGWVSDYASQGKLLALDDKVPDAVKSIYFEGLWKEQLVDGKNYQFPWYQGINVELINKSLFEKAGLTSADYPKTIEALPALCKTFKDKAAAICDIRLTVSDLLAQMVYEGGVKVISDDGKTFTFDSPDAVAWLNIYAQMVKDESVDLTALTTTQDRIGLALFESGLSPFYASGPNLARDVKDQNATLYDNLDIAPAPVGKSGVVGKGLMSISVKADTKYPNASIALAQYFTNPRSMVEFSKLVPIYPSSAKAYDDPFFSSTPSNIEDSARPIAKDIISKYADIVPTVPKKADVNEIVKQAIESVLFNKADPQQALSDAVKKANDLIK